MYVLEAEYLLKNSAPEVVWNEPTKHAEGADVYWTGSVKRRGKVSGSPGRHIFARNQGREYKRRGSKVIGAKRETINGQQVTVLPSPED
jgi:hypothetical protein